MHGDKTMTSEILITTDSIATKGIFLVGMIIFLYYLIKQDGEHDDCRV